VNVDGKIIEESASKADDKINEKYLQRREKFEESNN